MGPFKSNIDHLTPELMEKYLAGMLSQEDRYEVEKLLADSDFESEAMEGYEELALDFQQDLSQLNQQLTNRINKEKKVFPLWFKIAASVLILVLSSLFIVNYDFGESDAISEIAQNDASQPKEVTPENDNSILKDSLIALNQLTEQLETSKKEPQVIDRSNDEGPLPEETEFAKESEPDVIEPIAMMEIEEELDLKAEVELQPDVQAEEPAQKIKDDEALAPVISKKRAEAAPKNTLDDLEEARRIALESGSSMTTDLSTNTIKGQVTSVEDGEPLPGINIVLKGTAIGTVTDMNGNYSIDLAVSDKNTLVASFIGLSAQEVEVGDRSEVDFQLQEDVSQLSEVVVTGYSIARRKQNMGIRAYSAEEQKTLTPARPDIGKSAYKKYLQDNVNMPSDSISGKVIVKFDVLPDGSLTNFIVGKSPGPAHTNEAIRLIKEGPKWLPAAENDSAVTDQVRVRVRFK